MLRKQGTFIQRVIKEIRLMYMKTRELKLVQSVLYGLTRNVYGRAVSVCLAMVGSDYLWAKYIYSISHQGGLVAANWAAVVILLGSFVVIAYVEDRRMILPAAVGAWIGTYLAV